MQTQTKRNVSEDMLVEGWDWREAEREDLKERGSERKKNLKNKI